MLCNRKSRKGGRTFPSHANTESEQGVANARDKRSVGMGQKTGMESRHSYCNGLAKVRRSPQVKGGKARQETVSDPKEIG